MKDIIVTYDLDDGTADDYVRMWQVLERLGFRSVVNDVKLPRSLWIGQWFNAEHAVATIRDNLWVLLRHEGVPVSRLLVAEFSEAAWIGPPLNQQQQRPPLGQLQRKA